MEKCIFCNIVDENKNIILEDENLIAIYDIFPKSENHALVIPKNHFENMLDENFDFNINYFKFVQKLVEILKAKKNFEDYNLIVNNGKKAGQEVFHFHMHIVPRY